MGLGLFMSAAKQLGNVGHMARDLRIVPTSPFCLAATSPFRLAATSPNLMNTESEDPSWGWKTDHWRMLKVCIKHRIVYPSSRALDRSKGDIDDGSFEDCHRID